MTKIIIPEDVRRPGAGSSVMILDRMAAYPVCDSWYGFKVIRAHYSMALRIATGGWE